MAVAVYGWMVTHAHTHTHTHTHMRAHIHSMSTLTEADMDEMHEICRYGEPMKRPAVPAFDITLFRLRMSVVLPYTHTHTHWRSRAELAGLKCSAGKETHRFRLNDLASGVCVSSPYFRPGKSLTNSKQCMV